MTAHERVQAVADYGFTERQARFLVLVMRHAGLCVKRQYATFAGIAPGGEKCNTFFEKLVRRGYAVASDCIHNRARLYHVHHKPLYHAIGDPESRYRRAVPARRADERLMRLDVALLSPDLDWLVTRPEKLSYLERSAGLQSSEAGADATGQACTALAEQFPGTFPIGVDAHGRLMLVYLATVPWTDDFRLFLLGHTTLLSVTPAWTLRVVLSQSIQRVVPDYERAVHEELASPLLGETANDVNWYFFHRRRDTDWSAIAGADAVKARFARCAKAFTGPRFALLYRRWLTAREAALEPVSPVITEALASGRARLECVVLPHMYQHLSPLVSHRRSRRRRVTADAEGGARAFRSLNPFLNPAP
ncbi:MAG: hypothetical protein A3H96_09375 [Acidobacteria bacterium RIFCSPLOWO2_02_FULL_67_36]|nr:MAG: hypothetical protein A3H96_09375 [Acidobacteria bacterium RIFCSPLOWO2_02_FULL_67_36]OFW25017.1 MAG: hypothetical protein A3G21_16365 [Acidobacteria bacterium RIFCSPLOWO2_12_FULL_66_21]